MIFAYRREYATEPLALALERRGWQTIHSDRPGDLLMSGAAHIVLTPPVEYAANLGVVDYSLVPDLAIVSRGFAGLVRLIFNKGLVNIRSFAVKDAASSEALVASIVFSEKHDIVPRLIEVSRNATLDEMLASADAALLVGDDSIFGAGNHTSLFDISDEWEDMTEHPLPYMVAWGRTDEVPQEVLDELLAARDEAVLTLADIASRHPNRGEAGAYHQRYLRGDISYSLGPDGIDALDAFYRYAFYHSLVADIPTLKFLPEGEPVMLKRESGTTGDTENGKA